MTCNTCTQKNNISHPGGGRQSFPLMDESSLPDPSYTESEPVVQWSDTARAFSIATLIGWAVLAVLIVIMQLCGAHVFGGAA